jgi:malic enzyme
MAKVTNLGKKHGTLADAIAGADVFIGVSAPKMVTTEMVKTMNRDAILFACANPTPEIFPDEAKAGGAKVIATGRSDYPNQVNNVLAFPGIFRAGGADFGRRAERGVHHPEGVRPAGWQSGRRRRGRGRKKERRGKAVK